MSRIWSEAIISRALAIASAHGSATITATTPLDARRLRTAIYNFRRRRALTSPLSISISGVDVILHEPRMEANIVLHEPEATTS